MKRSAAARMAMRVAYVVACMFVAGGVVVHAATPTQQIPREWGMTTLAPGPGPKTVARPENTHSPAAQSLLLAPRATLIIGVGRVDPTTYLQRQTALASTYIVRSPSASIVEYLYPALGFFVSGSPLARLYDTGILPDIARAEDAARHYLDQPFTILHPAHSVAGYPSPTSTGGPPPPRMQLEQFAPRVNAPAAQATPGSTTGPVKVSGIARDGATAGFRVEPQEAVGPDQEPPSPQIEDIADLQTQLAAMSEDLSRLTDEQARLPATISRTDAALRAANEDLEAREALLKQGVLARNAVEPHREKHRKLAVELAGLRERESELSGAISSLKSQSADVKSRIEAARLATAAAEQTRKKQVARTSPDAAPRRLPGLPVTNPAPVQQPTTAAPVTMAADNRAPAFPSPLGDGGQHIDPGIEALAGSIDRLAQAERDQRPPMSLPPIPQALVRLGEPRWETLAAPTAGMVIERIAPDGEQVQAGAELLRVANTQWATVYADLMPEYLGTYRHGSPVKIRFDGYPGTEFEGWINNLTPAPDGEHIRAEICVLCRRGYFGSDAYATLQWLTHAAPLDRAGVDTGLTPVLEASPYQPGVAASAYTMLPLAPVSLAIERLSADVEVPGQFVGHIQVAELNPATPVGGDPANGDAGRKRLEKLAEWRQSFTEGMTSTIFADSLMLTYPAGGEVKNAIERMASGQVSNVNNRCARSMAEALGWGLGDAADWADRLPSRGYALRDDGLCRPGDILVWRFTYGARRTQHIGFAVLQSGKMMLLSNSSGRLGTSEILPGYLAFYRPSDKTPSPQ